MNKKYLNINEVSKLLDIKEHVIRYWDSIDPKTNKVRIDGISTKSRAGTRYFNKDNISKIKDLKKKKKKYAEKKKKEMVDKINSKIKLNKLKRDQKINMKNVSLGTSKMNYIDPRIIFAFIKRFDNFPVTASNLVIAIFFSEDDDSLSC